MLFGIIAIAIAVFLSIIDGMTWNRYEVMSPLGVLIAFLFVPLAIVGFVLIVMNFIGGTGVTISYRPPRPDDLLVIVKKDPSHISRVVTDSNTNDEQIIHGAPSWSYTDALTKSSPFKNICAGTKSTVLNCWD